MKSVSNKNGQGFLPLTASISGKLRRGEYTLVDQIKQRIRLFDELLKTTSLKSAKRGRFWTGFCPLCQTTPSPGEKHKFWVHKQKEICGCFHRGCKASKKPLDIINFHALTNNTSNRDAIRELWHRLGGNGGI